MKIIKVDSIPACDMCNKKDVGIYDAPTLTGSWANLCEECLEKYTDTIYAKSIGSKRELRTVNPEPIDEEVIGIDVSDLEEMMFGDANKVIECPKCGETREVEPDATYTFKCEGCGRTVRCPDGVY